MTAPNEAPKPGDMILYSDDFLIHPRWRLALVHKIGKVMWEVSYRTTDFSTVGERKRVWGKPSRRKIQQARVITGDPDEIAAALDALGKQADQARREVSRAYDDACLALIGMGDSA